MCVDKGMSGHILACHRELYGVKAALFEYEQEQMAVAGRREGDCSPCSHISLCKNVLALVMIVLAGALKRLAGAPTNQ